MSYNDNDNDSYGSSNRQGGSGGYGNDRVGDRDTGLGGNSGGFGNDSDSYGSGGARTGGIGSDNAYEGSGNDTYGSSGNDNRGVVDKAKDKLSSDRTDRPDDPITGTNYDQSSSGRNTGYGDNSSSGFGGNSSSGYGDNSSSGYGNDNRGVMDKAKDKLSSDRSDRPDDPISGTNYDQGSSGRNTGYGDNSSSGYGDNSSSSYGNDNRGVMDKAKDKLSPDRTDRPDDPITGTNYDQSNTGRSGGLGGDSYGSSDRTGAGGYGDNTSSNFGDNSSSNYGGVGQDNRSFTEKAKDKLSGNRSDRPDDPISGKNYGEDSESYGNNNNNKPSLMDKVKDKVGLNKDKNDNSYGGSDNYGSSGRNDNY